MTAPVPAEEPHYDEPEDEAAAIVAVLAIWLASSAAVGATMLPADLVARLVALGYAPKAVAAAGRIALTSPPPGVTRRRVRRDAGTPSAAELIAHDEPRLRALYLWNATKRLTVSLAGGVDPVVAFRAERRNLDASRTAAHRRARVAAELDREAEVSPWLEWRAVLNPDGTFDDAVTPDCRRMHGRIFTLDNPPPIGLPGLAHPRCRCRGRAFGGYSPARLSNEAITTIRATTAQPIGV